MAWFSTTCQENIGNKIFLFNWDFYMMYSNILLLNSLWNLTVDTAERAVNNEKEILHFLAPFSHPLPVFFLRKPNWLNPWVKCFEERFINFPGPALRINNACTWFHKALYLVWSYAVSRTQMWTHANLLKKAMYFSNCLNSILSCGKNKIKLIQIQR